MRKITVGTYSVECYKCKDAMLVMRIGHMNEISKVASLTCRCETCARTRRTDVYMGPPKKKVKKPAKRTIAGLTGTCSGKGKRKEWRFTYPTKHMPLLLRAKKYMGYWEVHFGEMRMGSGKTMKEALEQAKRRMNNCGYELAS